MSETYYNTPCRELSQEQRAHRLAGYLWSRPERKISAGVCQVCGHALKVAYRGCKPHENGEGIESRIEAAPGSEQATKLEQRIANGSIYDAFEKTGWLVLPVMACDALDPQVWSAAQAINEAKRRERANVGKPAPAQPEPAPKQPRRFGGAFPAPLSREQLTA